MTPTIALVVIENDPEAIAARNGKIAVITYARVSDDEYDGDDYEQIDHVEFDNFRDAKCAAEGVAARHDCEWVDTHPASGTCPH